MFCVQEAYDRNCHAPCHTAETTTADNAEREIKQNHQDPHTKNPQ